MEELCQDKTTSTSLVDENNTSTFRLEQKVCVEREVVCLEASPRMLDINCKFNKDSNDQLLKLVLLDEEYTYIDSCLFGMAFGLTTPPLHCKIQ